MKLVDCQMIKSKYFCLEKVVVKIIKMTVKVTENCVKSLMVKGINAVSIVVLIPTVFFLIPLICKVLKYTVLVKMRYHAQTLRTVSKVLRHAWI